MSWCPYQSLAFLFVWQHVTWACCSMLPRSAPGTGGISKPCTTPEYRDDHCAVAFMPAGSAVPTKAMLSGQWVVCTMTATAKAYALHQPHASIHSRACMLLQSTLMVPAWITLSAPSALCGLSCQHPAENKPAVAIVAAQPACAGQMYTASSGPGACSGGGPHP